MEVKARAASPDATKTRFSLGPPWWEYHFNDPVVYITFIDTCNHVWWKCVSQFYRCLQIDTCPTIQPSILSGSRVSSISKQGLEILLMEEIRRSPVEVGSLSHYLQGLIHPTGGWPWDFFAINSIITPREVFSYHSNSKVTQQTTCRTPWCQCLGLCTWATNTKRTLKTPNPIP